MSDEFESASTEGMESEAGEPAPEAADDENAWEAAVSEPSGIPISRRGHVISDKTRELFKTASKSIKEQLAADDDDQEFDTSDEPVTPAPAVVVPPAAASSSAASPAATAAPAPSLDPAVLAKVQQLDARAADLDARDKAITERQTAIEAGDLGRLREVFYDKGGAPAIVELIKLWTGATTDTELQDEVADLITELSGHTLGVSVPSEIKTRLDAKRALKGVKAHQAKLDKREADLEAKQQKTHQTQEIQRAVYTLDQEVRKPELAKQYPFLTIEANAGELIYEAVDAQFKRDGTEMRWTDAAKRVDDYLAKMWHAEHDKRAHLFTASPATAGVPANGKNERPQGDPQGIRRSHTLTNAANGSAPDRKPAPDVPANGKWSNEDHRARTRSKMRAAFKAPPE